MVLKTPRLELRMPQFSDAPALALYANNRNIWNRVRNYFPHPYTREDAVQFIQLLHNANDGLTFGIFYQDECIGVVGANRLTDVYCFSADFGYWIAEPFWGNGFTTEAVQYMVPHLFKQTNLVRLQSSVFSFNTASRRVLEKCDFQLECIAKNACIKNDELLDEYRYVMLKHQ